MAATGRAVNAPRLEDNGDVTDMSLGCVLVVVSGRVSAFLHERPRSLLHCRNRSGVDDRFEQRFDIANELK